jgi:outer membrane protein OmpA-like peptidoglycan-associated protein
LLLALVSSVVAGTETVKTQGLIKSRSGATLMVESPDQPNLVVLLTDFTQVGQIQGALKLRRKDMSMAYLIPGLAVQVEGTYNDQKQLVAKTIKFKGDDLKQAQSVRAGMHETRELAEANREQLERHNAELKAQNEALKQQQEVNAEQQRNIAENEARTAANKTAIEAAIARFGQLDDFYILDEVTIYFGNGKTALEPQFKPQLLDLAQKARTIRAYNIEIKGYASSVGSEEVNQKLSEDRAHNVASFLIQQGGIPLTNMLAPGAMGESQQVGDNKSTEGEAQNRRVVVRILQNKGIAGI